MKRYAFLIFFCVLTSSAAFAQTKSPVEDVWKVAEVLLPGGNFRLPPSAPNQNQWRQATSGASQRRQEIPTQMRQSPSSIECEDWVGSAKASAGNVVRQGMSGLGAGWSCNFGRRLMVGPKSPSSWVLATTTDAQGKPNGLAQHNGWCYLYEGGKGSLIVSFLPNSSGNGAEQRIQITKDWTCTFNQSSDERLLLFRCKEKKGCVLQPHSKLESCRRF